MEGEIIDPRDQAPTELFGKALQAGLSERNVRRLLDRVLSRGELNPEIWQSDGILSKNLLAHFRSPQRLNLKKVVTSPLDGFSKLLFHTSEGYPVETVIIPLEKDNRVSICLSSQVGCVMGCIFCATGRMKERRNLRTWEIIDQFLFAKEVIAERKNRAHSIVFMGMGEPFLNYNSVIAAAELISYPVANAISERSITISTVGMLEEIYRYTDDQHPYRLSISLGAATDDKRARLVPVAAKSKISEVMKAARYYATKRKTRIMLAYVCISGENVSVEDAKALGDLIQDTPVRLDLIEVTDPTGRFNKPTQEEMSKFRDALRVYVKQPVARRYSGGSDINAACGTLSGNETLDS